MTSAHAEKITIFCDGNCGRSVTLRKSKVRKAQYYLCASKISGKICEDTLPELTKGKVRSIDMNAAANFWGYTDKWPTIEEAQGVMRAKKILALGLEVLEKRKLEN